MLSHLRFHRRGASNPTSPTPDQQQHCLSPLSSRGSPIAPGSATSSDALPLSSSSSALPPTLPPITRVTSADADLGHGRRSHDIDAASPPDARPPQASRFLGGVALQKYCRGVEAQQISHSGDQSVGSPEDQTRRRRLSPTSTGTEGASDTHARPVTSFSTPTELQKSATNTTVAAATAAGRRPAAARLPNDVSSISGGAEPQRGKKGLPFLKNPMSTLLMRRKNNQNTPDLLPLPLPSHEEEPVYDPRIRGTRVHDFSAPRRKQIAARRGVASARPGSRFNVAAGNDKRASSPDDTKDFSGPENHQRLRNLSNASDSAHLASISTVSQFIRQPPRLSPDRARSSSVEQALALVDGKPAPPVPPKDNVASSSQSPSPPSASPPAVLQDTHEASRAHTSTRTIRSMNISLSDMSALPKHMKSTSSRFSFDMVGAAKQERLLEERHRQRELERQSSPGPRDSRFDDFDEDAFDYDVMMNDDGLEEKIPGINADYEQYDDALEDELDPDNDQENFAGFVFQRSNPASSLASPQSVGMILTPRDTEGKVIGFAMTKDTTPSLATFPLSPDAKLSSLHQTLRGDVSGLGIQAPCTSGSAEAPRPVKEDDLYFDDGLIDLEHEFAEDLAAEPVVDSLPFDESIFDNADTDRFGRPVPGAFAQAQSLRCAAKPAEWAAKRQSDMTSRLSAHSGISRTTAHTSPCVDAQDDEERTDNNPPTESRGGEDIDAARPADVEQDSVAAYQAALAAAAHKAAASGKFQRNSSPPRADEESQGHAGDWLSWTFEDGALDDIGPGYVEMDDAELDDDAIIAEANASALANDSDGWYGQEFGFYSAPVGQNYGAHNPSSSKSSEYEYANGGFFGPKGKGGLDRSNSGRMVSREPNLTPITERSEYSNRNSLMSLGLPPLSSSTPLVQSPGLAQLAMMADRGDDQMTLSALLRLRSRAWGGSQASLASSREDSPRSERGDTTSSPWGAHSAGPVLGPSGHGRKNSVISTVSRDSEPASTSGSPTLTMACPSFSSPCPVTPGPVKQPALLTDSKLQSRVCLASPEEQDMQTGESAEGNDGSGVSWRRSGKGGHDRHKGSADSVCYLKEEERGETRWVMERRRTAESGQVEILEREVVEGGRI